MNIFILIVVFVITVSIFVLYNYTTNDLKEDKNKKITLTDEHGYAHFALKSDLQNSFKYTYTLNAGDCIHIPKNFWHKVDSYGSTIGLSFWFDSDEIKYPKVTNESSKWRVFIDPGHDWTYEYLNERMPDKIWVWDQNTNKGKRTTYKQFVKDNKKQQYLITLPAYDTMKNHTIANKLSVDFPILSPNYNVWICQNDTTTDIHYDDYGTILCVIKGRKTVTIYPPSVNKLKPLNLIPPWVIPTDKFKYNIYKTVSSNIKVPSSRFLYETLKATNCRRQIYDHFQMLVNTYGSGNLIWGCKYDSNTNIMRWEVYHYRLSKTTQKKSLSTEFSVKNLFGVDTNEERLVISSIDIYVDNIDYSSLHLYYTDDGNMEYPFKGSGETLKGGLLTEESKFYINEREIVSNNLKEINDQYNLIFTKDIINKYKCKDISLWYKNGRNSIQYLGVIQEDFINFLYEYSWPLKIIDHYVNNWKSYSQMEHEIMINYFVKDGLLIKSHTSIYGML